MWLSLASRFFLSRFQTFREGEENKAGRGRARELALPWKAPDPGWEAHRPPSLRTKENAVQGRGVGVGVVGGAAQTPHSSSSRGK